MTAVSRIFTIMAIFDAPAATPPQRWRDVIYPLTMHPEQVPDPSIPADFVWQAAPQGVADFLTSLGGARLVSDRVREVVEPFDTGEIVWLPVTVRTDGGDLLSYWFVHYPKPRDVFDVESTTYGPSGLPIRWVVDLAKVQETPVFMVPGTSFEVFLVHPEVKDALLAAGVTGMDVRRTRT